MSNTSRISWVFAAVGRCKPNLTLACIDLPQPWTKLLSFDAGERKDAVAQQCEYIREWSARSVKNFFCVVIPDDAEKPRLENYKLAVESYGALGKVAEENEARILFEGWLSKLVFEWVDTARDVGWLMALF